MFKLDSPSPTPSRHSKTLVREPFASLYISLLLEGALNYSMSNSQLVFQSSGTRLELSTFLHLRGPGSAAQTCPTFPWQNFPWSCSRSGVLVRNITAFLHPSGRASDKIFANIFAGRGIGRPWHVCDILSHLKSQRKSVLTLNMISFLASKLWLVVLHLSYLLVKSQCFLEKT